MPWIVPSNPESFFGKDVRLFLTGAVGVRDELAVAAVDIHAWGFTEGNHAGSDSALVPKSLITLTVQDAGSRHVAPLRRWLR